MPPQGEKRVAPISSSAFSFSLGTPTKKKAVAPATPAITSMAQGVPFSAAGPGARSATTPLRTPIRPPRPVSGLSTHSPLVFKNTTPGKPKRQQQQQQQRTPRPAPLPPPPPQEQQRKQQPQPLPSPFLLVPQSKASAAQSPRPERKLNTLLDGSPFRTSKPVAPLVHAVPPAAVALREPTRSDIEDVGVSPRKFKGNIQYKGPGPPPSVRLATLLSATNTALVLFYTAQQHALRSAKGVLRHLHSAPVRLEVTSLVGTRTHAAVMLRCAVRQWPTPDGPDALILVCQALPGDCPLVGTDPRVVAAGSGGGKRYEVGVWAPWSEGPPMAEGEEGRERAKVLFASRYLIAEVC